MPKQKGDEELFGNEISTGINFDKYKDIKIDSKASWIELIFNVYVVNEIA